MITYGMLGELQENEKVLSRVLKHHDEDHAEKLRARIGSLTNGDMQQVLTALNKISRLVKTIRESPITAELA